MDVKGNATNTSNSDFENIKAWENNTNLDYYLSEEHWNFHVNQILYKNLLVFHEGKEVGAFLDVKEPDFGNPIKDYTSLYGNMFNEAYSLCKSILTIPVPETKVAQFANQSATWKFRNLKDKKGKPIKFEIAPNVTDLIESYHILGMVNAILCFANDQSASVDRFMIALSVYKDKGLPFCGNIHCFELYNEVYQKFIFATVVDGSYLRSGFDYKKRDEYLRENLPWYNNIAKEYEKNAKEVKEESTQGDANRTNMTESVIDKISPSNMRVYYEGWRNGKHGSICQSNGIYRFVEMTRGKSGILDDVKRKEDDNPIVAKGIVSYWLQFNSRMDTVIKRLTKYNCEIPKDIREQFANYTQIRFEQFRQEHRDDPNTWDWDWDREFYANVIIPHEMGFNKQTEALFDYISDSDIELVRGVMNSYIKYLKKCRADKGYRVSPELLVLRAIDSGDETKYEDLEEFEINTILDKLENMGCVKVAWVEGHRPEAVRLLDKGRFYLKTLEEGKRTDDIEYDPTSQQSAIKTTPQGLTQTQPQVPEKEDENWDDSFDGVFTAGINPQKVFSKLEKRDDPRVHEFYPRFFVFFRVLLFLGWIENHQKHFLEWANHHWECGWKKPHNFKFGNNIQKELRDADMSTWNDKTCNGSDIGDAYRNLAKGVLELFSEKTDDNKIKDRVDFYEDSEACLINNGDNLDYPF